jgi:hypothetical protein
MIRKKVERWVGGREMMMTMNLQKRGSTDATPVSSVWWPCLVVLFSISALPWEPSAAVKFPEPMPLRSIVLLYSQVFKSFQTQIGSKVRL